MPSQFAAQTFEAEATEVAPSARQPSVVQPPMVQPGGYLPAPAARPVTPAGSLRRRLGFWGSSLVTGALILVAAGIGLMLRPAPVTAPAVPAAAVVAVAKPPSITVVQAVSGPITETAVLTGTLAPREEVLVAPQIDGLAVDAILVEEGDRVQKGQVLARLSRETIETSLAQNQAQLAHADAAIAQAQSAIVEAEAGQAQASSSYQRSQSLSRSAVVSTDVLEQREALAKQADARLVSARQALKVAEADKALAEAQHNETQVRSARTEVRAPAAGVVSQRNARLGSIASAAGEPLFRLIEDGAIELQADVPETTLARLTPGLPAEVTTAARIQAYAAHVRLVAPEVNATTRLGRVRLAIDAAPGLTVGAFGRAQVKVATRDGVLIPQSAVLYAVDGPQVQLVKDGVVSTKPVGIGLRTERQAEIRDGVARGDQVVATAGTFVNDGDHITPVLKP